MRGICFDEQVSNIHFVGVVKFCIFLDIIYIVYNDEDFTFRRGKNAKNIWT